MIVLKAGNLPTWQDDARRMHKLERHNTVKAPWGDRCIRSGGSITCPMPGTIRKPKSGKIPCSITFRVSRPGPMPPETTRAPGRGSLASPSRDAMDENGAIGWRVIAGISRTTCSSKNTSDMSISPSVPKNSPEKAEHGRSHSGPGLIGGSGAVNPLRMRVSESLDSPGLPGV